MSQLPARKLLDTVFAQQLDNEYQMITAHAAP